MMNEMRSEICINIELLQMNQAIQALCMIGFDGKHWRRSHGERLRIPNSVTSPHPIFAGHADGTYLSQRHRVVAHLGQRDMWQDV